MPGLAEVQQKVDGVDYKLFCTQSKSEISEVAHGDGFILLDNGSTTNIFKG